MGTTLDIKAFLDKDEQKDLLRLLTAGSVDDGKSTHLYLSSARNNACVFIRSVCTLLPCVKGPTPA